MIKWTKKDFLDKIYAKMMEPAPGQPVPPNEVATRKLLNLENIRGEVTPNGR